MWKLYDVGNITINNCIEKWYNSGSNVNANSGNSNNNRNNTNDGILITTLIDYMAYRKKIQKLKKLHATLEAVLSALSEEDENYDNNNHIHINTFFHIDESCV